ncbi:MAG: MOSC domain-containing protein [Candidatus Rokuibacteriota bacterium]
MSAVAGRIVRINVSRGGVPKHPVARARVTALGLEGDAHRDTERHGGPERALCLFALERIEALRAEGHPMSPGTIGENLTVAGLDWDPVGPGARFRLGADVLIEVTRYTRPCVNIGGAFRGGRYGRVSQTRHPGWSRVYARVVAPGEIRAGDPIVPLTPCR